MGSAYFYYNFASILKSDGRREYPKFLLKTYSFHIKEKRITPLNKLYFLSLDLHVDF